MLWIPEVEMVDSVDEWKSSRSIAGNNFPTFEMLDAKIAFFWIRSSTNPISRRRSVSRNRKPRKMIGFHEEDSSFSWSTTILWVIGAHDTVLDFADSFSITLRNDNVQEFETRWDDILESLTKIPSNDILESLYKLRIRESDQLKVVLELYDMEVHQKISMPFLRDWRRWWREAEIRNLCSFLKSHRWWSGIERGKGICNQWRAKAQCSKGDQCCYRHESNDRSRQTPKATPLLTHQLQEHEVEVRRE